MAPFSVQLADDTIVVATCFSVQAVQALKCDYKNFEMFEQKWIFL